MAKLTFTSNTNQSVDTRGGVTTIVCKGTMGSGTIVADYQTAEMAASSEYAAVCVATETATPTALSITAVDKQYKVFVPAGTIKFTMTGGTGQNVRVYVDTVQGS